MDIRSREASLGQLGSGDLTGQLGVAAVQLAIAKMRWAFRAQPQLDLGIDGQIEVLDEQGRSDGRLIACQIKSGPSFFKEIGDDCVIYRGDSAHLAYWLGHSLPVVVVLHDPSSGLCYWQVVARSTAIATGIGWKLQVPFAQVLNDSAKTALDALADTGWIESLRTFTTRDKFFKRFQSGPLLDFTQTLRGRDAHIGALNEFLDDPNAVVAVLTGRGGIGKSKLLFDWTGNLRGWTALFKKETVAVHATTVTEVGNERTLIIVDDAHRHSDLDALLQIANDLKRDGRNVKVALVGRPVGRERISAALSRSFDPAVVRHMEELKELSPTDTRELVREILGAKDQQLGAYLAEIAGDTPLVIVVGGKMLARGDVSGVALPSKEEFKQAVFNRILADIEAIPNPTGHNLRPLLHVVAALQPVLMRNESVASRLASFLGWQVYEVRQAIDELESSGIVARSNDYYRIVPDMFGDFLLERAAVNIRGESTGYADEVYAIFRDEHLSNLLQNLAELDYRVGRGASVLSRVWSDIVEQYKSSGAAERGRILQSVTRTAFYQPEPILNLVRIEMGGSEELQTEPMSFVPDLLHRVAYHDEYRKEALERLWGIAHVHSVTSMSAPAKASAALNQLARYSIYKSVTVNADVAAFVESVSPDGTTRKDQLNALQLVDILLEKEGEENESVGMSLILSSFPLNYPVVRPVREVCFRVIRTHLTTGSLIQKCRALDSLDRVIHGFLPKFGRTQSREEIEWQRGEQTEALALLADVVSRDTELPFLREVRSKLEQIGVYAEQETHDRIELVLGRIPQSRDLDFFDAYCTPDWEMRRRTETAEDIAEQMRRHGERVQFVAQEMTLAYTEVDERLNKLAEFRAMADAAEIRCDGEHTFCFELTKDPQLLQRVSECILNATLPPSLSRLVAPTLQHLREASPELFLRVGLAAIRSTCAEAIYSATQALHAVTYQNVTNEDLELTDALLARTDIAGVFASVCRILRNIGKRGQLQFAVERILRLQPTDKATAESIAEAFVYDGPLLEELSSEQFKSLLGLFEVVPDVDQHDIGLILTWAASHRPDEVFGFLLGRLQRLNSARERNDWEYKAITGTRNVTLVDLSRAASAPEFLRSLILKLREMPRIKQEIRGLFWQIANAIDVTGILESSELMLSAAGIKEVASLVAVGPSRIAFDNRELCSRILKAAELVLDPTELTDTIRTLALNTFAFAGRYGGQNPTELLKSLETEATEHKNSTSDHLLRRLYAEIATTANDRAVNPNPPIFETDSDSDF